MGRIAQFIKQAREAGLRSQTAEDIVFLAQCGPYGLILSEGNPAELDDDPQIAFTFGEPSAPDIRPPQLVLRLHPRGYAEASLEPEDAELPEELLTLSRSIGLTEVGIQLALSEPETQHLFDAILDRMLGSSLACAS